MPRASTAAASRHDHLARPVRARAERVREAGLDDLVEIREQDYRRSREYSRVASIEMFEAIGLAEHERYFATIDRLLAPEGSR